MDWQFLQLLLLIITANGAPIMLRFLARNRMIYPVDFGYVFFDNKRLLGNSKTWRGLIVAIATTSLFALLLGYSIETGLLIASGAMSGDLLSSFVKRRLGMRPSSMAPFLDQIPESLFPALLVMQAFDLTALNILYLVSLFVIFELTVSRLLYEIGIRKRPY
ncbi:CDP-2,3-bis-(O-geranylgeranyl)-sn-glycerol synthase [Nitrosomonas aestuarii]|uniref:CDP-2,3-bis-(O-geranylgeranyl)-sn-glycerol synthase n=1 Tax=Nitrosomonas aestuarii TaxID=52441 RepID=A0A1I3Z2K7_9PROT|nr:CDP-archaeol synthase [Nitrosomonas aestuarii]SFK38302.1 CDP-2,3-bis-(O-geranylgeranyl)-sn-glycerol synthase [Nitrosomonas aestuarii]